ncbi:MAG: hypothetical protein WBD93_10750, partial [Acidobacteriaceae bacterium]
RAPASFAVRAGTAAPARERHNLVGGHARIGRAAERSERLLSPESQAFPASGFSDPGVVAAHFEFHLGMG